MYLKPIFASMSNDLFFFFNLYYQRSNCQHLLDHKKKLESSRKASASASFDYAKVFVWITTNYGKFLKRWEYKTQNKESG